MSRCDNDNEGRLTCCRRFASQDSYLLFKLCDTSLRIFGDCCRGSIGDVRAALVAGDALLVGKGRGGGRLKDGYGGHVMAGGCMKSSVGSR